MRLNTLNPINIIHLLLHVRTNKIIKKTENDCLKNCIKDSKKVPHQMP